ncbi:MAG: glycosyltransferase family 4 protein [Microcystis aeruginosa LL13-06]|nr:glycosyltransferase family 4 protein [Microcystis aeruginosa LL13-06]
MKILFIITRADTVGGAQVHVRDLAKFLQDSHHQVLVVTGIKGIYNHDLQGQHINNVSCQYLSKKINLIKDWKTLNFLQKIIAEFQPDIISTHSSKAGILGRLAARKSKTPCIFTVHGWAFTGGVPEPSRTIYQWSEKITEPLANKIICVSEQDRLIGLKTGMQTNRLLTIHNGMPDVPAELRANPSHANPVRIVMVARFDQQKDHVTLLKAFQNIPEAHLDLVGDGPDLEKIKTLAKELKIIDRINFLGFRTNVAEVLAQAQIFTLISNWEGFPRTTIEAMRAGLPVIVSDVGGASEAIMEGITGYIVPWGDVNTLHQRLLQLVLDAQFRTKMGAAGRKRYEAEYTFEKMFEKTFQVYEQVLEKRTKNDD